MKTSKQLEKIFKGVANHWRIEILLILEKMEGIYLDKLAEILKANIKTISEHTRRLNSAGLIEKKYQGSSVSHILTPEGKKILRVLKTF